MAAIRGGAAGQSNHHSQRCLNPKCGNLAFCRGLCQADYQAAWKLVGAGQISWAKLEEAGLALPAGKRGLGYRNSFRQLILEAAAGKEDTRRAG